MQSASRLERRIVACVAGKETMHIPAWSVSTLMVKGKKEYVTWGLFKLVVGAWKLTFTWGLDSGTFQSLLRGCNHIPIRGQSWPSG